MKVWNQLSDLPILKDTVITIGSFDGVHYGHRQIVSKLVRTAQNKGVESVLITFHPHPRQVIYPNDKDPFELLSPLDEKIDLLSGLGIDHLVIIPFTVELSQLSPHEYVEKLLIKYFQPQTIIIGYDHRFGLNRKGDITFLKEYSAEFGFEVIEISKQDIDDITISSTKIRNNLYNGEIREANKMLVTPYRIRGKVVSGDQLGSELGYPTANIQPSSPMKLIPGDGVYAVHCYLNNNIYDGMLYIGEKPSVSNKRKKVIEVNLLDFKDNIYGDDMEVELIEFVRDDIAFSNIEALKNQIADDQLRIESILEHEKDLKNTKVLAAIAILNYNGREYLESYLPSLQNSSQQDYPIYVIDNGSEDDSIEYLKEWHPEVHIIALVKNYGFAGGYNEGLKSINAKYYVIVNSDIKAKSEWLDPLINVLENNAHIAGVQPKILSLENPKQFEYAGAAGGFLDRFGYPFCRGRIFENVEEDNGQYDTMREVFWTSGAAMVFRAELFHDLGGFDAEYFAHQEEIDLCWRAKRAGYGFYCIPESVVYHLGGGTLDYNNPRKAFLNFRNSFSTMVKNQKKSAFATIFIRFVMDKVALWRYLINLDFKLAWAVFRALVVNFFSIPILLNKRNAAKKIIEKITIDKPSNVGRWNHSIVWSYFIENKKRFEELPK